jgi:protein ImuA
MVPFHLQPGSDARLQGTKEEIISKLRGDMIRREGFRPPLPGTDNDLGLGAVAKAFPGGVFPAGAIHEFISSGPEAAAACGGFIAGLVQKLLAVAVPVFGSVIRGIFIRQL